MLSNYRAKWVLTLIIKLIDWLGQQSNLSDWLRI